MATALSALLTKLGSDFEDPSATGTVTSGTLTTTVIDTARDEIDDRWNNKWVYIDTDAGGVAPQGQERKITDFANSTGTMTVDIAFTAAPTTGDTYSLREAFSRAQYVVAINHAIGDGTRAFGTVSVDETTVIKSDTLNYSLPTGCKHIYQVWVEEPDSEDSGTATSGGNLTLTDTGKSWTTNDWAAYELRVYDGTGAGQVRTISSNTATILTVSVAWTTNPDSTSEYKIVDVTEELFQWSQIRNCYPDIEASKLRFYAQQTEGARVRIVCETEPSELSATTDETEVPVEYILNAAKAHLWSMKSRKDPNAEFFAQYYYAKAEEFKRAQPYRRPSGTFWATEDISYWPYLSPYGRGRK